MIPAQQAYEAGERGEPFPQALEDTREKRNSNAGTRWRRSGDKLGAKFT